MNPLRSHLVRLATDLRQGSTERRSVLALLKGEDPGKEALEKQADEARETDLHKNLIRIASEFPPGSTERRDILALLKEAEESDAQDAEAAEDRAQADESKAEAEQDEAEADEVKEASEKGRTGSAARYIPIKSRGKASNIEAWVGGVANPRKKIRIRGNSFGDVKKVSDLLGAAADGDAKALQTLQGKYGLKNLDAEIAAYSIALVFEDEYGTLYTDDSIRNNMFERVASSKSAKGAKKKLPEELEKHQFTSEDNPNPKGNDKDGDGETNEPSPIPKKKDKKATLERVAATLKEGTAEHTAVLKLIAGCEKLPEGPMRDNCEKKKKEGEENDEKEKKDKKDKKASLEKQAATYRSTLIKAASILPVGSDERKTMLTSIKTADKWIQDAIKRPGRLHKFFGIPEGKDIPVAKIKGEIEKLKKKEEKTPEDKSLMGALQLGLRLKAMK